MLELVFVIVVIGILAAAIIPRFDRDTLYEASEQLLSHIKYTQHLAMVDNVYDDTNQNWFQNRWGIAMSTDDNNYSIGGSGQVAVDPTTGDAINGTGDYDLSSKYNVGISIAGVTGTYRLVFDHLGRPYNGVGTSAVNNLLQNNLIITLTAKNGEHVSITVRPETGYASLGTFVSP